MRLLAFSLFKSCFFLAVEIEYFSAFNRRCRLLVENFKLFSSRIRRFVFLGLRSRSLLTTLVALLEILEGRPNLGFEEVVEVFFFFLIRCKASIIDLEGFSSIVLIVLVESYCKDKV